MALSREGVQEKLTQLMLKTGNPSLVRGPTGEQCQGRNGAAQNSGSEQTISIPETQGHGEV